MGVSEPEGAVDTGTDVRMGTLYRHGGRLYAPCFVRSGTAYMKEAVMQSAGMGACPHCGIVLAGKADGFQSCPYCGGGYSLSMGGGVAVAQAACPPPVTDL